MGKKPPSPLPAKASSPSPAPARPREEAGGSEPPSAKPTPVRQSLPGESRGSVAADFGGRAMEIEGTEWWVQELGWSFAGRREDPGAVLLLLGFRLASDDEDEFSREAVVPHTGLDQLTEDDLAAVFATAGPFRSIPDEPKPFFGPPGGRRKGEGTRGRGGDRR